MRTEIDLNESESKYKKVGVLPIRIVWSNVSSICPSSERNRGFISICISTLPTQHTTFKRVRDRSKRVWTLSQSEPASEIDPGWIGLARLRKPTSVNARSKFLAKRKETQISRASLARAITRVRIIMWLRCERKSPPHNDTEIRTFTKRSPVIGWLPCSFESHVENH